MPIYTVRKKIFQHSAEDQNLVVRGSRILFFTKKEGSSTDLKNSRCPKSNPSTRSEKPLENVASKSPPFNELVNQKCIENLAAHKQAHLKRMMAVDRSIQVGDSSNHCCREIPDSPVSEESRAAEKEKECKTMVYLSAIKEGITSIDINLKDSRQSLDSNNSEKCANAKVHEKELSFAQQLKSLADGCSEGATESLEVKGSVYVVLKEARGIVLVQFPDDLEDQSSFNWESSLLEAEEEDDGDEVDLTSQGSISSAELLTSESNSSSPVLLARRKTLYPEPCPAFPMESSFPPVEFD